MYFKTRPVDSVSARYWESGRQMSDWEYFTRSFKRVFESYNTVGQFMTEREIGLAEVAEDTADMSIGKIYGLPRPSPKAMTEAEYKSSEYYDQRIPWSPRMTATRARILKENRDRLDAEDAALDHDSDGIWRGAVGLGAHLMAALPDPVNLIPLGSGVKAMKYGTLVAVKHGLISGAASNVAADMVILPVANMHGEDVGFSELAKDAMFGAVIGGALGAAGHGFARWLKSGKAKEFARPGIEPPEFRPDFDFAEQTPNFLDMAGVKPLEQAKAEGWSYSDWVGKELKPEAAIYDGSTIYYKINGLWYMDSRYRGKPEILNDLWQLRTEEYHQRLEWQRTDVEPEGHAALAKELEALERVRGNLLGQDRVNVGKLISLLLRDIAQDKPLDVAGHARRLGLEAPPFLPDGLPVVKTARLVAEGQRPLWKRDMDFAEMIPLARDYYLNNLAGQTIPTRLGDVEITAGRWGKIVGELSPDKLRLIPFLQEILRDALPTGKEPARNPKAAKQGVVRHFMRSAVELDGRILDVTLSVQEAQNGKFFFNLTEWGEFGREGKRNPPDSSGGPAAPGDRGGDSGGEGAYLGSGGEQRQTERQSASTRPETEKNITPSPERVNLEVRDITPNWTPEPPMPEERAITPAEREIMDRAMEAEAERILMDPEAMPEERAALEQNKRDLEALDREEQGLLAMLECIVGAADS